MLYYLTNSLLVKEEHPKFRLIQRSIKRLGLSAVESNHLILGDYDILCQASKWFRYDNELFPLFSKLLENYSMQVIPSFIKYYLELVLENPIVYEDSKGRTVAQICLDDVSDSENVAPASLIVEDLNDAVFYDHIFSWYRENSGISANFRHNNVHGGGGRIVEVIKDELRKKHVSLAILDTDKRYPSYDVKKGKTYKSCIRLGRKAPYYCFLPLYVHEIENLIPPNYIDSLDKWITEDGRLRKSNYDRLKTNADSVLPYFDIKKGINKSSIAVDHDYYEFASKCYELNPELVNGEPDFDEYVKSKGDKDIIYYGLIENIMKAVLERIKQNDLPDPVLYDFQKENWICIGQHMTDWFIARNNESLY